MGLTQDIEDALMKSLGDNASKDAGKGNVPEMAKSIATAVIKFIQEQTFTITEMKAVLEVETMKTAGPLQADVLPSVVSTVAPGQAVVTTGGPGSTTSPGTSVVSSGTKGVLIPPINVSKTGGQGGVLMSKGHAYIGQNPVSTSETNEKKTKVKLVNVKRGTK